MRGSGTSAARHAIRSSGSSGRSLGYEILEYRGDIATMLTTTKFRSHPLPIGGYAAFYCDIQVHV